jgi:hypothetical protein
VADLHAWRNAATELPPEGVPVWGINDVGICAIMVNEWMDDGEYGGYSWANSYGQIWQKGTGWDCDAEHDDDYRVRYWHPLPDVPTLAELDGAQGVDDA